MTITVLDVLVTDLVSCARVHGVHECGIRAPRRFLLDNFPRTFKRFYDLTNDDQEGDPLDWDLDQSRPGKRDPRVNHSNTDRHSRGCAKTRPRARAIGLTAPQ